MLIEAITPARIRTAWADPPRRLAPGFADRDFWQGIDPDVAAVIIAEAEALSARPWPMALASQYARFQLDGDREEYQGVYFDRRTRLAAATIAALITGSDRWITDVIDGVWLICDEATWTVPAHATGAHRRSDPLPDRSDRDLDLFCAETGALLSWVDQLLGERLDSFTPTVRRRLRQCVADRVIEPFIARRDWRWLHGFVNNWNPWIHSNVLTAALLIGDQVQRCTATELAVRGLDVFLDSYHDDGGCDEGASYWNRAAGSLIDALGLLADASGGALDGFDHPKIRPMAEFLPDMHLRGPWYVNFADCPAQLIDRSIASPLLRAGHRYSSPAMLGLAAEVLEQSAPWFPRICSLGRVLHLLTERSTPGGERNSRPEAWYRQTEVLVGRSSTSDPEITLAAKGGHNAESHNHNDVGSFIIAADGVPVVVDLGVGTYTKQTFSADRYQIFTMQSGFHNLPVINRTQQLPGRQHAARAMQVITDDDHLRCELDIAAAYPDEADVESWLRTLVLDRSTGTVTQTDRWRFGGDSGDACWHLMLAGAPSETAAGVRVELDDAAAITIAPVSEVDQVQLGRTLEEVALDDPKLTEVWGPLLHRLIISPTGPLPRSGSITMTFSADRREG